MFFFRAFSTFLLLVAFGWCLAVLSIFLFGRKDEARPADAIVVLGAAQYDGRPSPVLKARLDHAIDLHTRGFSERMILTGGVGVGDTVSEAEVGRRYAIGEGVPAKDILLERGGLSSGESMRAVVVLMESHGLSSAILVSDPFHMLRLRLLASRLDLDAYSSPTRSSPIGLGSHDEWWHVLRESLILPSLFFGDRAPSLVATPFIPR
ncbi:MAG: YdcF family protein [Gemmatimonas sp.]|nr:YdcF family protein [Gemmatimonas sp.]